MMKAISVIWGLLSLLGLLIGFIPFLGSLNWLNIPFACVGFFISLIALVRTKNFESKSLPIAGIVMCGMAIVLGSIRLFLGGGIL
jgi:hypothetical protein